MMNKMTKRSGLLSNVADRCVRLSPKGQASTETYKGQTVIPLDAAFFPSSTISNMTPFRPHPTHYVSGDLANVLNNSVSQFAQHNKPSRYWSASQVEVGVVRKISSLLIFAGIRSSFGLYHFNFSLFKSQLTFISLLFSCTSQLNKLFRAKKTR